MKEHGDCFILLKKYSDLLVKHNPSLTAMFRPFIILNECHLKGVLLSAAVLDEKIMLYPLL